jgi:urea transport system permease protein
MTLPELTGSDRATRWRWAGTVPWRWIGVTAAAVLLAGAPFVLGEFRLDLLSKYLCLAIVALGICLAWGRGGMLTLGQGVFFGLGGYAMGMYLKLHDAGHGGLPDFMVWSGVQSLPALWKPFANPVFALAMVVVLPVALAVPLGLLVFRQRVRGAYFAVLTQALAAAFVILLVGQQGMTGGTNGLTNFSTAFGVNLYEPATRRGLYWLVLAVLGLLFLASWLLVRSRFGKLLVAVRDGEDRVRFLGYDPAVVKTVVFALAAAMAGIAGALFVPVVGNFSPSILGVVPSIEMVIAVAIGGRYSLAGAVAGALLVNYAKTTFSELDPGSWLYLQGGLFIAVMVWAPRGLAGLLADARDLLLRRLGRPPAAALPAGDPAATDPTPVGSPAAAPPAMAIERSAP